MDSDETSRIYAFSLDSPEHGACFNIGLGPDGTALISYSDLCALYELPDGTKWAEHGALYDMEDMVPSPPLSRGRCHCNLSLQLNLASVHEH